MRESFKKDVLAIACGIIIGCVLIHHTGWQLASWLMWAIGMVGGAAGAYVLRLAFEPKRVGVAAKYAWQKVRQVKWHWPSLPKWQATKAQFMDNLKQLIIEASVFSWLLLLFFLILAMIVTGEKKSDIIALIITLPMFIHFLFLLVLLNISFSKDQEKMQNRKKSTVLKWNFVVAPFSLLYYVVVIFFLKMGVWNFLKFGWKFFVSFTKLVHSSTATSCAAYAAIFILVVATISSDIFLIIALGIVGGLIGALMRRLVPKWCHWQYPQTAGA